ncbi:MAG: hypothetical protein AB2731_19775 [Candidatus Thiodiazotropha sp.]|nr:hypothetical protein [Candidatus Thiodiazotropha sp. (ex Codakia orbicularis)]PUB71816.1 MAG: hypothetical protein DBP03_20000 [gamma proteobacterium symbiont of Ctena orbiculata]
MIFKSKKCTGLLSVAFFLISFNGTKAIAQQSGQLAAISDLGRLNGIALHCKALGETQRMKRVLVATLPKRRQLGELFDYETNRSFMAFIERDEACPSPQSLTLQVDEALQRLQSLYPAK